MSFAEACESWNADIREQVRQETFGHLAPMKNRTYRGRIVYAVGCFSEGSLNPTPLVCDFKTLRGEELDSSPWFYDALLRFIGEQDNTEGCVYEFTGKFRNYEFIGEIRLVINANEIRALATPSR